MHKRIFLPLLAIFLFNLGVSVTCGAMARATKTDAQYIMGRTAAVVTTAQRFASQGQKYDGLGMAVSHQLLAGELFARGAYTEAIFHSLRSRALAARVVKMNKSDLLNEALYDRMEEKYAREIPSDRELDQKLKETQTVLSDQAAVDIELE